MLPGRAASVPAATRHFGIPVRTNSFIEQITELERAKCSKYADEDAGSRCSLSDEGSVPSPLSINPRSIGAPPGELCRPRGKSAAQAPASLALGYAGPWSAQDSLPCFVCRRGYGLLFGAGPLQAEHNCPESHRQMVGMMGAQYSHQELPSPHSSHRGSTLWLSAGP